MLREHAADIEALLAESERDDEALHTPHSLDYFEWRYGAAPGLDYRCITVGTSTRLDGIAFGRLRRRGSLNEFTLSEVVVGRGDRRTARRLLRLARRSGADYVAAHLTPGDEPDSVGLSAGYYPVLGQGLGLVANPRRTLPVDPLDLESWRLSFGDLEVF